MDDATQLDAAFAALAHPIRRALLAELAKGEATVNALAAPFDMSLPAISRHLRVLEDAGLISRGRQAQFRPCKLEAAPLRAVAHWTAQYQHIWDQRFDALETVLNELKDTKND